MLFLMRRILVNRGHKRLNLWKLLLHEHFRTKTGDRSMRIAECPALFKRDHESLILQFEIQLKQSILKVLLQGQRPVPYQRGPAALVICPNRKMLCGLKARDLSRHDSGNNMPMGRAFRPCFRSRSDMI